jgi:hypothetical protein
MSKHKIFLLPIVFMWLTLTACFGGGEPTVAPIAEPDGGDLVGSDLISRFEFGDIRIQHDAADGLSRTATDTARFRFYGGRADEVNIRLVRLADMTAYVLREEYGTEPLRGRVVHFSAREPVTLYHQNTPLQAYNAMNPFGEIVIDPDSVCSAGLLFYGLSGYTLPAWLAAGLELYWADRFGLGRFNVDKDFDVTAWSAQTAAKNQPAFGDVWFAKTLLDETEPFNEFADTFTPLSISYAFVRWLDETDRLQTIAAAYFGDNQTEGDTLFADAWLIFTGQDIRGDKYFTHIFRYIYGRFEPHYRDSFTFTLDFTHGHYRFSHKAEPKYYTLDDLSEFFAGIDIIEAQYLFTKRWLGVEDFAPIRTLIPMRAGTSGWDTGERLIYLPNLNLHMGVYSSYFHIIYAPDMINHLRAGRHFTDGYTVWLEKATAGALTYLYAIENSDWFGRRLIADTFRLMGISDGNADSLAEDFAAFHLYVTGREYDGDGFDFKLFAHLNVAWAFKYIIAENPYLYQHSVVMRNFDHYAHVNRLGETSHPEEFNFFIRFLNSFYTEKSFALYLLDRGTEDDFKRFYANRYLAEEIYGKGYRELFGDWNTFIDNLIG